MMIDGITTLFGFELTHTLFSRLVSGSIELAVLAALATLCIGLGLVKQHRVVKYIWLLVLIKPLITLLVGPVVPALEISTGGLADVIGFPVETRTILFDENGNKLNERFGPKQFVLKNPDGLETELPPVSGPPVESVLLFWITGVLIMIGSSAVGRMKLRRLLRRTTPPSEEAVRRLKHVASQLDITKIPRLAVTKDLESPALAGTLRPVILLPDWLLRQSHRDQLLWALRHELNHAARRDHWLAVIPELVRALFFFHPLAWYTAYRWRDAAEISCDLETAGQTQSAGVYADQLFSLLTQIRDRRRTRLAPSLFATRTQIGRRIERLLSSSRKSFRRPGLLTYLLLLVVAVVTIGSGVTLNEPVSNVNVWFEAGDAAQKTDLTETPTDSKINIDYSHRDKNGRTIDVRTKGDVYISSDSRSITRLGEDSMIEIRIENDSAKFEYKFKGGKDGTPLLQYKVNGNAIQPDSTAIGRLQNILEMINNL
jgi:beta-lactamase regulating signal transducer with metallopeptidase domain